MNHSHLVSLLSPTGTQLCHSKVCSAPLFQTASCRTVANSELCAGRYIQCVISQSALIGVTTSVEGGELQAPDRLAATNSWVQHLTTFAMMTECCSVSHTCYICYTTIHTVNPGLRLIIHWIHAVLYELWRSLSSTCCQTHA